MTPRKPTGSKGRRPRQEPVRADFAQRMVQGARLTDLAREWKINRHTLAGWVSLPEVQAEMAALRARVREANLRAMDALGESAVATVGAVMTSAEDLLCAHFGCAGPVVCESCRRRQPGAPPRDRLKAAEIVLDRIGIAKRTIVEHAGEIGTAAPTREEATAILTEAAHIAEEEGERELAALLSAYIARRGKAPAGASSGYTSTTIPSAL